MALKGRKKAVWQRSYIMRSGVKAKRRRYQAAYMRLWRRADALARHRAVARFRPIKTVTQLNNLLDQGLLPEVAEYVSRERQRILGQKRSYAG